MTSGGAVAEDRERVLEAAAKIRHQHLDLRGRRELAHRADAVDEMPRAAVAQIVAVHARDDHVGELQRGDRPGEVHGLGRIERQRAAVTHVAERAAPRADVAHDHERRRALGKALADVRARGFLAHGVQPVLAQDLLDFGEARRRRRAHADPVGFAQPLGRHDLDGNARGLRVAPVLDAGDVGSGGGGLVHGQFRVERRAARIGASPAPASSTVLATPRSASWVTASPG